jgi:hypothetical protein
MIIRPKGFRPATAGPGTQKRHYFKGEFKRKGSRMCGTEERKDLKGHSYYKCTLVTRRCGGGIQRLQLLRLARREDFVLLVLRITE